MRTLRYLGLRHLTGLSTQECDSVLSEIREGRFDTIPDGLVNKLESIGVQITKSKICSRLQLLDYFRSLGRNLYISYKTNNITNNTERRNKVKELLLRTRREKVIIKGDLDTAEKIISRIFTIETLIHEKCGNGGYMKLVIGEAQVEIKYVDGEKYYVITHNSI